MAHDIEMPDGTVIEGVPDDVPKEVLLRKWKAMGGVEKPGFIKRTGERLLQGGRDVVETLTEKAPGLDQAVKGGDIGYLPMNRVSRIIGGDIPNALGDIAGDAMMTAGKQILPKEIQRGLGQATEAISQSAPVQAIGRGLEKWKGAHPASYELAGQVANLAGMAGKRPHLPDTNLGGKSKRMLDKALDNERIKDVARTLEPDKMDGPGDVKMSKLKTKQYVPTDRETEIINQVSELEGYNPRSNYTDNVSVVEQAEETLRGQLNESLEGLPGIDVADVRKQMQATAAELENLPALTGNPGAAAKKIYLEFDRLLDKAAVDGKVSPRDLIQVRRDLDRWMNEGSTRDIFDTTTRTANKIAGGKLRGVVNDIVDTAAPDQVVKDTLRKQSNLLTARDTLKPRSIDEAKTAVGRLLSNLESVTGISHPRTTISAKIVASDVPILLGATAVGAVTAGGRAAWDQARKRMVDLLKLTDEAINKGGPMATKLKADRAVMLSLLNAGDEEEKK